MSKQVNKAEIQGQDPLTVSNVFLGYQADERRVQFARGYGLPDTASYTDICNFIIEKNRRKFAIGRGLSEDATYAQIAAHDAEIHRVEFARKCGLPDTATYEEIKDYLLEKL